MTELRTSPRLVTDCTDSHADKVLLCSQWVTVRFTWLVFIILWNSIRVGGHTQHQTASSIRGQINIPQCNCRKMGRRGLCAVCLLSLCLSMLVMQCWLVQGVTPPLVASDWCDRRNYCCLCSKLLLQRAETTNTEQMTPMMSLFSSNNQHLLHNGALKKE